MGLLWESCGYFARHLRHVAVGKRCIVTGSFDVDLVKEHYATYYGKEFPEFIGKSDQKFTMILPPPNVTGVLHIGHALTVAIEDAICRFHRLAGKQVRWLPGFDHAGIATQEVVEKRLWRERQQCVDDLTPAEFLEYCTSWKNSRIKDISSQLDQLCTTLDWDETFYTMDEKFQHAIKSAFIQLHELGLIYRKDNQWYMDCTEANNAVLTAIETGNFNIDPDMVTAKLVEWVKKNEPWCLSRQQLWGHRVPAYHNGDGRWVAAFNKQEAAAKLGVTPEKVHQDGDVLDTWFSSALIPLIVPQNWPANKKLDYPLVDVMQTGHDIIGFWVARMLTVCHSVTGRFPFENISLHGLIRDGEGRKMSKSLGNVIDPLHVINGVTLDEMVEVLRNSNLPAEEIEGATVTTKKLYPQGIRRFGTDSLRFAMLKHDITALDVNIDLIEASQQGNRFCNKMWNAVRYVDILNEKCLSAPSGTKPKRTVSEEWIENSLADTMVEYVECMKRCRPHDALLKLHHFLLNEFCDVYVETTKKAMRENDWERLIGVQWTITRTANVALKAMSVFMPHVCNYLLDASTALQNLRTLPFNECVPRKYTWTDEEVHLALGAVAAIRSFRTSFGLKADESPLIATVRTSSPLNVEHFASTFTPMVSDLCNLTIVANADEKTPVLPLSIPGIPAFVDVRAESSQYTEQLLRQLRIKLEVVRHRREALQNNVMQNEKQCYDVRARQADESVPANDQRHLAKQLRSLERNRRSTEAKLKGVEAEESKVEYLIGLYEYREEKMEERQNS